SKGKDKSRNSVALGAVVESPLKQGLLYAGTEKGLLWVTHDGGTTWMEHSAGLPSAYVRSISPSKFSESRVYVALSGINYDDFNTYVYKSEDYGKTWEKITGNLPSEVAYVIKEDPLHENVLYAGLYRALYISVDRGKTWSQFGKGMPAAAVSDVEMDERSRDLVVSTHGRGIFKMNLKPLDEWLRNGATENDRLFSITPVKAPDPDGLPDGSNSVLYEKVPLTFWQTEAGEVTLSLLNDSSKVVWSYKMNGRRGFNQYRWDMIIRRRSSSLPYFTGDREYVKSGRYILHISTSTGLLKTELRLID
ncbi:MAG: WD40/YVTN/BNR-like repeat-containing protein, partial [Bacteroidota bacterium]